MSEEICATIRDTPLGECIGATILDITTEQDRVYFHMSNGKTIFATFGEGLVGMAEAGEEEEESEV
jgi:hypothetical protein